MNTGGTSTEINCKNNCMSCGTKYKYYSVNKAQFHSLCCSCAQGLTSLQFQCIMCKIEVNIDFLMVDPKLRACENHPQVCAYRKCQNKKHFYCDQCTNETCFKCIRYCIGCNIVLNDRTYCSSGHELCKKCFEKSSSKCPMCSCLSCGGENAYFKNSCGHYLCEKCKNLNSCNQCVKHCVFCKQTGKYTATKCKVHFMCFSCFGNSMYKFNRCIFCDNEEQSFRCFQCNSIDAEVKVRCQDSNHKICRKCFNGAGCGRCNKCERCKTITNCELGPLNKYVCKKCLPEEMIYSENVLNEIKCQECSTQNGKLSLYKCNKHYFCKNCEKSKGCSSCSINCEKCGIVYDLIKADCSHQTCRRCLEKYDCNYHHSSCRECKKRNKTCAKCIKKCENCNEDSYFIQVCRCQGKCCKNCSDIKLDCNKHFGCKKCHTIPCQTCDLHACDACGKQSKVTKQNCKYNHYTCTKCTQESCKVCNHYCKTCKGSKEKQIYNENCGHTECKKCVKKNTETVSKLIKCTECENSMKSKNPRNKLCFECGNEVEQAQNHIKCKSHHFCDSCWKNTFDLQCPLCVYKNNKKRNQENNKFHEIVQESCGFCKKIKDLEFLPCEIHKACIDCLNERICECFKMCDNCNCMKVCKKMECGHLSCDDCQTNTRSNCKKCCLSQDPNIISNTSLTFDPSNAEQRILLKNNYPCAKCNQVKPLVYKCKNKSHQLCSDCNIFYNDKSCGFCNGVLKMSKCSICLKHKLIFSRDKSLICFDCCNKTEESKSMPLRPRNLLGNQLPSCLSCLQKEGKLQICGHSECDDCIEKYHMCILCRNQCFVCKQNSIEHSALNEDNQRFGICNSCYEKYRCNQCGARITFHPSKFCKSCNSKNNAVQQEIHSVCLICDKFFNEIERCKHICKDCNVNFPECIFCCKVYMKYFCQGCFKYKNYDLLTESERKLCHECESKMNLKCHYCERSNQNLIKNNYCQKEMCPECANYFQVFKFCPRCSGYQMKICFECNHDTLNYHYACERCYKKLSFSGEQIPVAENNQKSHRESPEYKNPTQILCNSCHVYKTIPPLKTVYAKKRENLKNYCIDCLKFKQCENCKKYTDNFKNDSLNCKKCSKASNT